MLRLALALLFFPLAATAADTPDDDGFVSLFNGENLDGWTVMGEKDGFQVKDGVIHSDGETGGQWMRSEKMYGDYILKVDWRVSKDGNSGVFIRAEEEGAPWITGYEVQISSARQDEQHCTGSLYGYVGVDPRPDESHDTWHTFTITCRGDHITVRCDDVKCIDFDQSTLESTQDKPKKGYIGLQDAHAPAGHYIQYRNIRIKPLK
ncbi:MAG: DUF1080 domain-containing protein [Planctomycetota bacterium]|nr:MAG: DUF1080 domain-containing protein [Planctomycetota bacterium]REJ95069.1 MAG: DUF1080 domain-containing protein [Planctomycetota bacterium]REK25865.1 MAG: DUF1080 domain-containing protein [Planctomycetota bacterium]REK37144.1 MAG: DUF1080 domain-containing protein [Planctomycetota bacterium]